MTNDEYHAHPAFGSTAINCFLRSRRRFEAIYGLGTLTIEPSEAMETGSMFHAYLLEPDKLKGMYAIIPEDCLKSDGAINSKPYREWAAGYPGLIHYKRKQLAAEILQFEQMHEAIKANPLCRELIEQQGVAEKPVFFKHGSVPLKCKPDWLCDVAVDIKTTNDVSEPGFRKAVFGRGYHVQAALYRAGLWAAHKREFAWKFIAVSSAPPYVARLYSINEEGLDLGERKLERGLRGLAACLESGDFRELREHEEVAVGPTAWELKELETLEIG